MTSEINRKLVYLDDQWVLAFCKGDRFRTVDGIEYSIDEAVEAIGPLSEIERRKIVDDLSWDLDMEKSEECIDAKSEEWD